MHSDWLRSGWLPSSGVPPWPPSSIRYCPRLLGSQEGHNGAGTGGVGRCNKEQQEAHGRLAIPSSTNTRRSALSPPVSSSLLQSRMSGDQPCPSCCHPFVPMPLHWPAAGPCIPFASTLTHSPPSLVCLPSITQPLPATPSR
ncbi:hypothetical protein BC831DRAFT_230830 [Entophlyctis helioformis]|nr:hypothetical protein BC831DRAFT_230830 [Entophlyctis helioformis]